MVKNPPADAGDADPIPGSGGSPRESNGSPLQCSCLEKSPGQRSLAGYSPYSLQKNRTRLGDRATWSFGDTPPEHVVPRPSVLSGGASSLSPRQRPRAAVPWLGVEANRQRDWSGCRDAGHVYCFSGHCEAKPRRAGGPQKAGQLLSRWPWFPCANGVGAMSTPHVQPRGLPGCPSSPMAEVASPQSPSPRATLTSDVNKLYECQVSTD